MKTSESTLIGTILSRCPISEQIVEEMRQSAASEGRSLESELIEKGVISPADFALSVGQYLDMRVISLGNFSLNRELLDLGPHELWGELGVLPLARCGKVLTVAVSDPFDILKTQRLQSETDLEIMPVIALESQINETLTALKNESAVHLEDLLADMADESDVQLDQQGLSLEDSADGVDEAPVIRVVNSILIEAMRKGVSDIHIEPMEKSLRLRYRIDGVLQIAPSPPKSIQSAIASRLKIMSNLDISERRVPQDGRFKIKALGKEVDMRISFLPTVHGEKVVMRILDKSSLAPSLEALGLEQTAYDNLVYAINQPHGMICITGPTGSGKTTTLYSALQDINKADVNIITVEDPVEYQLPGINQVQADNKTGLTFAAALKSILRQDPDIVMIGEIRDMETGGIAVQAALTGHLVLSTLHTNDAPGAVSRLAYMGIEPFMISSALLMTQAQRLFRKLCPVCRQAMKFPEDVLRRNHLNPDEFRDVVFYEPVGCPKCNGIGYKGRSSLMEIMLLNEDIRQRILETTEASAIREVAERTGMVALRDVGLARVREGISSIEEILRVTTE